jgi:hypothetical protein
VLTKNELLMLSAVMGGHNLSDHMAWEHIQ